MPSFYRKLLENFDSLSRSFAGLPPVPSEADKKVLRKLEKLKVNDPFDSSYNVESRASQVSGIAPDHVAIEVREFQRLCFLTYWYFWPYDRFQGDHENWEPVTLVYKSDEPIRIDARIHDALISYTSHTQDAKPKVHFYRIGHTPVVKVKNRKNDVVLEKLNDGLDYTREKWLNLCFRRAENDGWQPLPQPRLECNYVPMLDEIRWKKWGKHSIYLRI